MYTGDDTLRVYARIQTSSSKTRAQWNALIDSVLVADDPPTAAQAMAARINASAKSWQQIVLYVPGDTSDWVQMRFEVDASQRATLHAEFEALVASLGAASDVLLATTAINPALADVSDGYAAHAQDVVGMRVVLAWFAQQVLGADYAGLTLVAHGEDVRHMALLARLYEE